MSVAKGMVRRVFHWETALHWWLAAGGGGSYWWYLRWSATPLPENAKDLITAVISVAGIVLAFLATFQGFLFSMQESLIVKRLRQFGAYDRLLQYFSRSINYCLLLLVCSMGMYFAKFDNSKTPHLEIIFTVWLALGILTLGSCCRIIWLFQQLLRRQ